MKISAFATLAGSLAVLAGMPAQAQPDAAKLSVRVDVADLNLDSDMGAHVALQRIRNAAAQICGSEGETQDLTRFTLHRACARATVNEAVATAQVPRLSELNGAPRRTGLIVSAR